MKKYFDSYKNLIAAKPLRIRFDKVNRFIGVDDGTRHLVLFGPILLKIKITTTIIYF